MVHRYDSMDGSVTVGIMILLFICISIFLICKQVKSQSTLQEKNGDDQLLKQSNPSITVQQQYNSFNNK